MRQPILHSSPTLQRKRAEDVLTTVRCQCRRGPLLVLLSQSGRIWNCAARPRIMDFCVCVYLLCVQRALRLVTWQMEICITRCGVTCDDNTVSVKSTQEQCNCGLWMVCGSNTPSDGEAKFLPPPANTMHSGKSRKYHMNTSKNSLNNWYSPFEIRICWKLIIFKSKSSPA